LYPSSLKAAAGMTNGLEWGKLCGLAAGAEAVTLAVFTNAAVTSRSSASRMRGCFRVMAGIL